MTFQVQTHKLLIIQNMGRDRWAGVWRSDGKEKLVTSIGLIIFCAEGRTSVIVYTTTGADWAVM